MSKNLTRKGLAFGALVALGTSLLAGAPAQAADAIVLATDYTVDTTLATPVTEGLRLNASLAPGSTAANIAQLKYKIETDGTFVAKAVSVSGTGGSTTVNAYTRTTQATAVGVADVFTASNAANDVLTSKYVTPNLPTTTAANTLLLSIDAVNGSTITGNTAGTGYAPVAANATKTVKVTAFIDANLNGTFDSGEVSQTQTVSFVKYSELTASTTITAPTQGDVASTAVVKFTNVNNEALDAAKVGAYFTKGDGTTLSPVAPAPTGATITAGVVTYTTAAAHGLKAGQLVTISGATISGVGSSLGNLNSTVVVASVPSTTSFTASTTGTGIVGGTLLATPTNVYSGVAYSATAGGFKYVTSVQGAFAKNSAVKVQPLFNATAVVTNTDNSVGTAQTAAVTTRSLGSFTGEHVISTTAKNDGSING
jgi:hypothetical protein